MIKNLNRRRFISGALIVPFLAFFGSGESKANVDPKVESYVKSLTGQVLSLANSGRSGKALRRDFSNLLGRYVSMRKIANFALGTYQKKLPAGDREMFYGLVSNYAAALFVYYVDDFRGSEIEVNDMSKQGAFTVVQSAIVQKSGGREQVKWRLSGSPGNYAVADVNIKGVWMTISMKKRFSDVLNRSKGDFGKLYEELREAETW
jgi:phospholipid transport system substrate-binding protein